MKRLLICAAVALAFPGLALSQTAPAKPAAPAKKAAAPAAKKSTVMKRDELRACMLSDRANKAETTAIDEEQAAFQKERAEVVASNKEMAQRIEQREARAKAMAAERAELLEAQKEFAKPVEKADLKAVEQRRTELNARIDAHSAKVEAYNAEAAPLNESKNALNTRIEASMAREKTLKARSEKYNSAIDDWKANCYSKQYEVSDEIAIKKELGL